ncbi:MAG: hypothetical protein ACK4OM_04755 [Alphaproteobacteria bacterium]
MQSIQINKPLSTAKTSEPSTMQWVYDQVTEITPLKLAAFFGGAVAEVAVNQIDTLAVSINSMLPTPIPPNVFRPTIDVVGIMSGMAIETVGETAYRYYRGQERPEKQLKTTQQELKTAQGNLQTTQQSLEIKNTELKKAQETLETTELGLSNANKAFEDEKRKANKLNSELITFKTTLESKEQEILKLKKELESFENKKAPIIQNLQDQITQLSKEKNKYIEQISKLEEKINTIIQEKTEAISKLSGQISTLETDNKDQALKITNLESAYKTLEEEKAEAIGKLSEKISALETDKKDQEKVIAIQGNKINKLEEERTEQDQKISELENFKDAQKNIINTLSNKVQNLNTKLETLEKQKEERDAEILELQKENSFQASQISVLSKTVLNQAEKLNDQGLIIKQLCQKVGLNISQDQKASSDTQENKTQVSTNSNYSSIEHRRKSTSFQELVNSSRNPVQMASSSKSSIGSQATNVNSNDEITPPIKINLFGVTSSMINNDQSSLLTSVEREVGEFSKLETSSLSPVSSRKSSSNTR